MNALFPIPTGLRPKAQGCEARATLGDVIHYFPQPQRGCGPTAHNRHNLVEVEKSFRRLPRVARASQPWAERHYPVGVNKRRTDWADESRTLAALRDALLPKLLSGELRVPAAAAQLTEASA